MPPRVKQPTLDRFMSQIATIPEHSCWEWIGTINYAGYGFFKAAGKMFRAHRMSYELFIGPIPDGLTIDHLCFNRRCVNPDHLEAVSARVNILRGNGPAAINARKTVCDNGHQLVDKNVRLYGKDGKFRACRACAVIFTRAYKLRKAHR